MVQGVSMAEEKVKRYVYERFPELTGVRPQASSSRSRYIYTFKKRLPLPGGGTILQVVRVTADEKGEILKVSVSR